MTPSNETVASLSESTTETPSRDTKEEKLLEHQLIEMDTMLMRLLNSKNTRIKELEQHLQHVLVYHGISDENEVIVEAKEYLGL